MLFVHAKRKINKSEVDISDKTADSTFIELDYGQDMSQEFCPRDFVAIVGGKEETAWII